MEIRWGIIAVASFAMLGVCADEGPTFEANVWRGETAYVSIPAKFAGEMLPCDGVAKDGICLELFGLRGVDFRTSAKSDIMARRLDVVEPCRASAGCPAFCKVAVSPDVRPGRYAFGPLVVSVADRVLPPPGEWKYFLDLWQHPWAVARYFGVKPFSKEHYAAMEPVYRTLAECGAKALTVTLLDLPWNHQCYDAYHSMVGRVKKADGSWAFDYSLFDEYVTFGRKCGIGPDIACYTMCPWGYAVSWKDETGAAHRAEAKPGTPEFEDYWGRFLVDFAAHLKEKGWFADTYIAMDERTPDDVRVIAEFIRSRAPGMKVAMAGNKKPSEFEGIVLDNYSQYLGYVNEAFLAEVPMRRANGFKTTFYVCCGPDRPNTFMDSGADEAFWLGAYPAFAGLDGVLRWAANSWPHDPYADASFGNWRAGDTFLVYPKGELSARLLALRAGIVVAEKMRILRESGEAGAFSSLVPLYDCKKGMGGQLDFIKCRLETEKAVNAIGTTGAMPEKGLK